MNFLKAALAMFMFGTVAQAATPGVSGRPGVMLGAHVGFDGDPAAQANFAALERAVGRKLAIDNTHEGWAVMPDTARVNWDIQNHRLTMITWMVALKYGAPKLGCASADSILAGTYDGQLEKQARAIKALRHPILIRFIHEMSSNKQSTCSMGVDVKTNPELAGPKYVRVWKYVVDRFRAAGVTNVQWVWSPGHRAYEIGVWRQFYPGDDYVDWIGIDDYNHLDLPRSFATDPGINAFYNLMSGKGKPLMIAETGASNDPSQKPDPQTLWLATARQYLKSHPAIKAFCYWNGKGHDVRENPGYRGSGYALQGPGLEAFREMADDPYFQ